MPCPKIFRPRISKEDPSLTLPKGREYMLVGASFMGALFEGTEYAENAERHGLFFKYKAVVSVSPVSSVPKSYHANLALNLTALWWKVPNSSLKSIN